MRKILTLNVIKKTGINQYYMDDHRVYLVQAHGHMQAKVKLKLKGSRTAYDVTDYELDSNYNLVRATIIVTE